MFQRRGFFVFTVLLPTNFKIEQFTLALQPAALSVLLTFGDPLFLPQRREGKRKGLEALVMGPEPTAVLLLRFHLCLHAAAPLHSVIGHISN